MIQVVQVIQSAQVVHIFKVYQTLIDLSLAQLIPSQRLKKSKPDDRAYKLSAKTKESDMKKVAFCVQMDFRATKSHIF